MGDSMDLNWLLGFIEGEGSFVVTIHKQYGHKWGICTQPKFTICLGRWDLETLEEIQTFLLEDYNIESRIEHRNRDNNNQLVINKVESCFNLIPLLNNLEWHTNKRRDYNIWSYIVGMVLRKEHKTKDGLLKIFLLREEMNKNTNRRNTQGKNDVLREEILKIGGD